MTDQSFEPPQPNPLEYASLGAEFPYKKWRTKATVFGIIAIVIGSCSALMACAVPLALLGPTQPAMHSHLAASLFTAAAMYLGLGGGLIWLGIGALKMRRWVRPLVLTLATICIIVGTFTIVSMVLLAPGIQSFAPPSRPGVPAPPAPFFAIVMIITMLFMAVLLLGIPGLFIWAYKPAQMKAALEYLDPTPRWTDYCPIPVLGLVMTLILYALTMLVAVPRAILPVFGTILHGPPAVAALLVIATVAILLARLVYKVQLAAWWGTVVFCLALAVIYGMTAIKSDQIALYRAAGFDDVEINAIAKFQPISGTLRLSIGLCWIILVAAYLAYIRQYFTSNSPTPAAPSA